MVKDKISMPKGAIPVTAYEDLNHFVAQFVEGKFQLLMLIGPPGVAKSQTIKRMLGNRSHLYVDNHATAFGLYQALYSHCHVPTVIDDLDHLYRDAASIRLLKCLCNTDEVKTLRWMTKHPDIGDGSRQVPAEFSTKSPVCLIANEWRTLNANVQAIEDRAIVVHFCPHAGEVHVKVREWFEDEVVYEFIEQHLRHICKPSMRYYVKGSQLRKADPKRWQEFLLQIMNVDHRVQTIAQLLANPDFETEAERIQAFQARGFGDRATYYRWKKKLNGG